MASNSLQKALRVQLPLPLPLLSVLTTLLLLDPHPVFAYTWSFNAAAKQCTNLTISVSNDNNPGVPPYRVLIIPFGPSQLAGNVEVRRILDVPFSGNASQVSFLMDYPADSQFVAVVSDSLQFGSGGTSVAAQVTTSSDASCFNAKQSVSPNFFFSIEPPNQIVQCTNTRIWWDPSKVVGATNFLGVIPGGQSFTIPQSNLTTVASQGYGFTWQPSVRAGTTLVIIGGDTRGNGTAGSTLNVVSAGTGTAGQGGDSCLNANSPSSTPGSPAGGSYPTGTTSTGSSSPHSSNTGAIAGGVVGGIVVLIIAVVLAWYFLYWKRRNARGRNGNSRWRKEGGAGPLDLINGHDEDDDELEEAHDGGARGRSPNELPQYYRPDPFLSLGTSINGTSSGEAASFDAEGRPVSGTSASLYASTELGMTGLPFTGFSSNSNPSGSVLSGGVGERRKGGAPRPMRTVNIIQHDDGGPRVAQPGGEGEEEEPVTIELPPAYTAVKSAQLGGSVSGTATGEGTRLTTTGGGGGGGGGEMGQGGIGGGMG